MFNLHLMTLIERVFVNIFINLCLYEFQRTVVTESSPFCVDYYLYVSSAYIKNASRFHVGPNGLNEWTYADDSRMRYDVTI
jgi:hypothetical protein